MTKRTIASLLALAAFSNSLSAHPDHSAEGVRVPRFFLTQANPTNAANPAAKGNSVAISTDEEFRYIKSNGLPDHTPGTFPRRGNPNTISAQSYSFRVPLKPKTQEAGQPSHGWWWGVALNGVPFEPGTGETWNNDPRSGWRYEAATGFLDLGLDENNAYVQPNGSYHYHALPRGLVEKLGGDGKKMVQVGWAADGFPIYTGYAYANPKKAKGDLVAMKSSYQLKKGARPAQDGGPGGNYDGKFTQDFEFVKGSGDLDECNGRFGVTPEFPKGTYYYCITDQFPFVPRLWRGVPDQSFQKNDRPPGFGRPGGGFGGPGGGFGGPGGGFGGPGGGFGGPGGGFGGPGGGFGGPGGGFGGPGGGFGGPGGGPGGATRNGSLLINALDLNHDGVLDADEIAKAASSLKALDKNGDGKLSADEYRGGFGPPGDPGRPGGDVGGPGRGPDGPPGPPASPKGASLVPGAQPVTRSLAQVRPINEVAPRANVLILLADDLGWNGVGSHSTAAPTPNLNQLAKDGVELQRFYTYPVCSPARAALLTGQFPIRFGIVDPLGPMQQGLPKGVPTMPAAFRAAGYTTSLIGKWHLGHSNPPQQCGFDKFYGFLSSEIDYFQHTDQRGNPDWQRDGQPIKETGYSTYLFADEAIRQIKNRDAKRPFFIEVAFNAPHAPLSAPEELLERHKNAGGVYSAVLEGLDTGIGRILKTLDEEGLRENTLVVFFSDNGSTRRFSSNAPLSFGKDTVYEGGIRTPCVLRWPGQLKGGTVSQQPVSAQDLFPTIAAATMVPIPANTTPDGSSQWLALREGKALPRSPILIASHDNALIDGDWKFVAWSGGTRSLFHLTKDISETKNELEAQPEIASRLGEQLATLVKGLPPAPPRRPNGPPGRGFPGPGARPGGAGQRPPAFNF